MGRKMNQAANPRQKKQRNQPQNIEWIWGPENLDHETCFATILTEKQNTPKLNVVCYILKPS